MHTVTSLVEARGQPQTLIVSGTATIPHVAPGAEIACQGAESNWATVPSGVAALRGKSYSVGLVQGSLNGSIRLSRSGDGTVTVTCSKK